MTDGINKGQKLCVTISLPKSLAGFPVRIEVAPGCRDIAIRIAPETETNAKYAFVWNGQYNLKVAFDDILWVEASGSYSTLHLSDGRHMTVSFNLSYVEGRLPSADKNKNGVFDPKAITVDGVPSKISDDSAVFEFKSFGEHTVRAGNKKVTVTVEDSSKSQTETPVI